MLPDREIATNTSCLTSSLYAGEQLLKPFGEIAIEPEHAVL